MPDLFKLVVRSKLVSMQTGINGVPLAVDPADGIQTELPLNEWLMPGENRLTVRLAQPVGIWYTPGNASLSASIEPQSGPALTDTPTRGNRSQSARRLPAFTWPMAARPEAYPFTFSSPPFDVDDSPTKLWRQADVITRIGEEDRLAIVAIARSLLTAMSVKSVERVSDILNYRTTELALAYNSDINDDIRKSREFFSRVFASEGFAMAPLDEQKIQFHIVANGRLVWVTQGMTGKLLSTVRMPTFRWSLPVFVAKIGGQWIIAR